MKSAFSVVVCASMLACNAPESDPPMRVAPNGMDGGVSVTRPRDAATTASSDASVSSQGDATATSSDASVASRRDAQTGSSSDSGALSANDAGVPAAARAPVFGLTVTDPWAAADGPLVNEQLRSLSTAARRPTVRVVFDEGVDRIFRTYGIDALAYVEPVSVISRDARVMGELLDSLYMPDYSVETFRARACEYRAAVGHRVDVWEVGNEINGEWLGTRVIEKILAAIDVLRADRARFENVLCPGFRVRTDEKPFEIALTLYENGSGASATDSCWERPENEMLRWTRTHFGPGGAAADAVSEIDHVLVSYYEDDCNGLQPNWQTIFDELGAIFPSASLAIGECGTTESTLKARYVERYYQGMSSSDPAFANMRVDHPRFVGGYFWWYFSDDLRNTTVMDSLRAALGNAFWTR